MKKVKSGTVVKDCQFYGVKWDKEAIQTLQTVADALLNLTKVFASTNIEIKCLMHIDSIESDEDEVDI